MLFTSLQFNFCLQIQISSLESLVKDIEIIAFHLSTKKKTPLPHSSTSSRVSVDSSTYLKDSSPRNLIDFDHSNSSGHINALHINNENGENRNKSNSNKSLNSISDAAVQIEGLRIELERVQMGLTLMRLSIEKLMDIISIEPSCCGGFADIFFPLDSVSNISNANSKRSSVGDVSKRPGQGLVTNSQTRFNNIFPNNIRANAGRKRMGYENINATPSKELFSIESHDEEDV